MCQQKMNFEIYCGTLQVYIYLFPADFEVLEKHF